MPWRLVVGSFNLAKAQEIVSANASSYSVSHSIIIFEYSEQAVADSVVSQLEKIGTIRLVEDFSTLRELIEYVKYKMPYE